MRRQRQKPRLDHAYAICEQRRVQVVRNGEVFLEAFGGVSQGQPIYPTRKAAQREIMTRVNAPDWEHRNPHAANYFYWAKRVNFSQED